MAPCSSAMREAGRFASGSTQEKAAARQACGFLLPGRALLHQRIRHFCDGLVLGSAAFVEAIFRRNRRRLGLKRKVARRVPRIEGLGDLHTLRDLPGVGTG